MSSKELKIEAKSKLANGKYLNLLVINIFYALIISAFLVISQSFVDVAIDSTSTWFAMIASIISLIISAPLSYGVLVSTIKIVNGEEVTSTQFLNIGFKNFAKIWSVYLKAFLKMLPSILILILSIVLMVFPLANSLSAVNETSQSNSAVIFIIGIILYIIAFVYVIVKGLSYSLVSYILNDNDNISSTEVVNTSEVLMKGNKWNFVKLSLSFIGWYLLVGLVGGIITTFLPSNLENLNNISQCIDTILVAALAPYLNTAIYIFYEKLKTPQAIETTAQDSTIEE